MTYLLIALGVLVVLVVLYLVARRVKPFGQSLAFVCIVLSRVNVKLAEYLTKAADYCHSACLASLRYPPGIGDTDYWPGVNVLSRLVYFALAVSILGGETVNTLLVLPSLFQTATHVHLPGIVELASAALFICTPAFLGAVILECCGLIPHGAGLFPRMSTLSRWILGVLSGVFLMLAILLTGYFYLFRAAYLLDPQSTQGMSLYILCGLGLEIAAVSVLALVALVVGGCGVVSLLLWAVEQGCRVFAGAALFLPSLLDVLAVHLSQGTMSVHGHYIGHDPYKVPTSPFALSGGLLPGQTITEDSTLVTLLPELTQGKEKDMRNPGKNAAIVFVGNHGTKLFDPVAQAITRLRATESFLTSFSLDLSVTHISTAIPSVVDCSPTQAERKTTLLQSDTEGQAYALLLRHGVEGLVETHLETKASPAPLIFVIDCHVLVDAVEMLEAIKRRLPLHSVVVVTAISAQDSQSNSVQTGMTDMQTLVAEGFIETVIVTDPRSPFALKYGETTQLHFLAHTLVGLVIAHKHSLSNRSCTDVFQELHRLSPFTTLSFASEAVAIGTMPKRWAWLPFVSGQAGVGNFSDTLAQIRAAIQRLFTEEKTRAFTASVDTTSSCIVLCSSPYELNNRRFHACVRDTALYVSTHYPFASALTVRGNGCPYPYHMGSKYLVTAALLYPLHPASFPKLQAGKQQPVTSVLPLPHASEPTNGTGNTHTDRRTQEMKQTPAPSSQAKTSPPASRRGRKQTKAAQ